MEMVQEQYVVDTKGKRLSVILSLYNVGFKLSVHKDFRRLPKSVVGRAMKRIEKLKNEPFPHSVDKLEGVERLYRVRVRVTGAIR